MQKHLPQLLFIPDYQLTRAKVIPFIRYLGRTRSDFSVFR